MRLRSLILAAAVLLAAAPVRAADPVSHHYLGELSLANARTQIAKTFKAKHGPPKADRAVRLYRLRYRSTGVDGRPVVLSGLVALPRGGAPKGLALFCHGTTVSSIPSRYAGADAPSETQYAVLALATGGYAVIAPDYLGLGDDKDRFHPYPFVRVNANTAIDMIDPARKVASKLGVEVAAPLYVTGYSEGGGVAMWAARLLSERAGAQYRLTAAAPLSGAYDLTGVTARGLVEPQSSPRWLAARLYLAGYLGYSMHRNLGVKLNEYFAPNFARQLPVVFAEEHTDQSIFKRFTGIGLRLGVLRTIQRVLTPRFRKVLTERDMTDPILKSMAADDSYDWSPTAPLYLVCLKRDFVVLRGNTIKAVRTMRARGVGPDLMAYTELTDDDLNHITAPPATLALARRFFDRGFAGVPLSKDP